MIMARSVVLGRPRSYVKLPAKGEEACVAGHAAVLFGCGVGTRGHVDMVFRVMSELDLAEDEAKALFFAGDVCAWMWATRMDAVRTLRNFAKSGVVAWRVSVFGPEGIFGYGFWLHDVSLADYEGLPVDNIVLARPVEPVGAGFG